MKSLTRAIGKNRKKSIFISSIYWILYFVRFTLTKMLPTKMYLKLLYRYTLGRKLHLKNPKFFNEKIQWKKIYDRNPIYITCTDKYAVRNYIKDKIGEKYLVPLLQTTTDPDSINFSSLPKSFIIKANHGSGWNIIIKDKNKIDEKYKKEIIETCKGWLKSNYYNIEREWQYKYIKPRILIEKLLTDKNKKIPSDYKFHCFNGKVEFVQVDIDRFEGHKRGHFYSDWKPAPFKLSPKIDGKFPFEFREDIPRPSNLKEMLKIAQIFSKDFDYVRVDLYSLNNHIYFGELTFSPGGGYESFFPDEYNLVYGNKLKLKIGKRK